MGENGNPQNKRKNKLPEKFVEAQFKPGKSGNPGGRPKGVLTAKLDKQLLRVVPNDPHRRSYAQLLIESMVKRAISRSDVLVKEIFDRMEGKLALPVIGEEDLPPVQINVSAIPKKRNLIQ